MYVVCNTFNLIIYWLYNFTSVRNCSALIKRLYHTIYYKELNCLPLGWYMVPDLPPLTTVHPGRGERALWLYFVHWGCAALKGMFFTVSVWEGCRFQPNSLARVCFLLFLSGKGVVFRSSQSGQGVCFDPALIPKFWQGL